MSQLNLPRETTETLEDLIESLEYFCGELEKVDPTHDRAVLFRLMDDCAKYISKVDHERPQVVRDFLKDESFHRLSAVLKRNNFFYIRALETEEVSAMLKSLRLWEQDSFNFESERIAESYFIKQAHLSEIDFSGVEKICMVGCGPMPETLIYLAENTPAKQIIGLDYHDEAIFLSGDLLRSLRMKQISTRMIYGEKYDYGEYDFVYVPIWCEGKQGVLERVVETAKPGTIISVRDTANHLSGLFYETCEPEKLSGVSILQEKDFQGSRLTMRLLVLRVD